MDPNVEEKNLNIEERNKGKVDKIDADVHLLHKMKPATRFYTEIYLHALKLIL